MCGDPLRRWICIIVVLLGSSGWLCGDVGAQRRAQPIRIGVLTASWGPTPQVVGLLDGLRELGYREHQHFVMAVRFTQGDLTALPKAAQDLITYGVELIIADSDQSAKVAQQATTQIPIVFVGVSDPVGVGLIETFARPGGNITGVTDLELELGAKRLEVFLDLIPHLKRVFYPYDAADTYAGDGAKVYREAAHRFGIELVERPVRTTEEAQAALAQLQPSEVDGILHPPSHSLNILGFMLEATARRGLPTMFNSSFMAERGGLASYGPNTRETGRQAARLVAKIFNGANPAEIPVEMNSTIEYTINLKVAKTLGLTISPMVLYRADRLIR